MSAQHTPSRFRVSDDIPASKRAEGYTHEVVDSCHASDGGPVAISWHECYARAAIAAQRAAARAAIAKATK